MIAPLRKKNKGGELYHRRDTHEVILAELLSLDREEQLRRCAIRSMRDPKRVPSECLVYLVRACKFDNSDVWFNRLWPLLLQRVRDRIPKTVDIAGNQSEVKMAVRDEVEGGFMELISEDREDYSEALDYFEVSFDGAMASRRLDASKPAWRNERRSMPLENPERPGEISAEVEEAVGEFDPFEKIHEENYRLSLDAAIEALPEEQIRIIEMLRQDIPIDSKNPDAITIAKTLGRSEKTIRLHRDKAFAALRRALEGAGR
ncbi:RNA polymerase sigma factor [Novosphingobium rosa]|uniref:hypothetical protein n=1 Tax=Novosphingobium rosa TaxID=76978 RepID=UPI0008309B03|nr:hypothetical protein [Novosphingobium rosa]